MMTARCITILLVFVKLTKRHWIATSAIRILIVVRQGVNKIGILIITLHIPSVQRLNQFVTKSQCYARKPLGLFSLPRLSLQLRTAQAVILEMMQSIFTSLEASICGVHINVGLTEMVFTIPIR